MNISPKERYLDICHFKRPGDLWLRELIPEQTLGKWVEQGAPKELITPGFCRDYFQFQRISGLGEIKSSLYGWAGGEKVPIKPVDLGHGIMMSAESAMTLSIPAYEPRLVSEDERTVTYMDSGGKTAKRLRESLKMD